MGSAPPAAPLDRSERAAGEPAGGGKKLFFPKVADNPLIRLDSLPQMEGNGREMEAHFGPF